MELQISLLSELSEFNLEQKNFSASLNYSLKAYDLAQSMNSLFQISSTAGLVASAYESIGDYKNAFLYTQTKLESIQELNQEQNKQITEDLLIKYESEKKDLQNQSLIKEQQLLDLEIKRKNELLLGTGIIVLGLIAGWIVQSRKKKQLARAHAQTKELLNELKVKNEEIQIKAKDLQESNLALLESNRIRQRLFSVISHDLKAPLSSLNAILDIWGDQLISQEEFQNLVPKVSNQLGLVRGLMDNLLEWAQAELDHSHISYSEVRVAELIDLTVGHLSPLWQEKSLTISNQVSPSLVLETDKDRLSFVLRNLISNAIKYSDVSGKISLNYDPSDQKLSVIDSGVGMTEDRQASLFSGRQSSMLGTAGEKGTGVGLLLSKEFAESLGAKLVVESELGKGSVFSLKWK